MIDQIRDFLAAGPERRKAMESAINSGLHKYLGPTGIPQRVGAASEVFNPVVGIEQAGTASRQMMDPRLSLYDRIGAGGRMATEIAGVAAPAGAARLTGMGGDDAARALEEALTGFSARPGAVAAKDFAGDEAAGMRLFRGTTGSSERIKGGIGEGYIFASPHQDVARLYGENVAAIELSDTAKILKEGTPEFARITGRKRGELLRTMRPGENLKTAADDAIARAKEAGFDAVEFTSMRDMGVAILNPGAIRAQINQQQPAPLDGLPR